MAEKNGRIYFKVISQISFSATFVNNPLRTPTLRITGQSNSEDKGDINEYTSASGKGKERQVCGNRRTTGRMKLIKSIHCARIALSLTTQVFLYRIQIAMATVVLTIFLCLPNFLRLVSQTAWSRSRKY